jgi:hypothetical protein
MRQLPWEAVAGRESGHDRSLEADRSRTGRSRGHCDADVATRCQGRSLLGEEMSDVLGPSLRVVRLLGKPPR